MNVIENIMGMVLPYIISVLEIMGIVVVTWSGIQAFYRYIQNTFFKKQHDIKFLFAAGLATGLEFKMAAEILKTVLIHELSELVVLGVVILLRAILSILIHIEMRDKEKS